MSLLAVLLILGGLTSALAAPTGKEPARQRPNIIFILADDLGWRDLGCYGSTFYETPNLDRLAATGIRFTDAYAACCVCSPTRASILTGKYPAPLGITDWLPGRPDRPDQKLKRPPLLNHLPLEENTFAEALKETGYKTAFLGKWHLGGPAFYPEHHGFDLNIGGCELGHPPSYFSPYKIPTLPDGPKGEYLTDRLTDEALKFIDGAKGKPFLLYLSHYAVHNPQQAKAELIEKYKAKAAKLPTPNGPEFLPQGKSLARQIQNQPVYAAMVQSLDESVGRILKKLAEAGLEENTVVMFTSDNGGLSTAETSPTSNVPLRAGKGWPYEGGVREPLLVRWPGVTKPGSICHEPMISTDYYPTLLQIVGLPLRPGQHQDGVSLVPLLKGDIRPERPLFWHYPHYSNQSAGGPSGTVRLGEYKLIEWYEDMRVELFNLKEDLSEHHDLAKKMPEKVNALRTQLHDWRKEVGAAMPTKNQNYKTQNEWIDPATGHLVVRLSKLEGSSESFYFHQNAFTEQGDKMVFFHTAPDKPRRLFSIDLQTRALEQLSDRDAGPAVVGPRSRQVYYLSHGAVCATHLDTHETKIIAKLPPSWGGLTVNADETLLAGVFSDRDQPSDRRASNPGWFEREFEAKRSNHLYSVEIKTGKTNIFYHYQGWLGHVQFSPTDPALLMFCHEGPWHKLDRIWQIRADGSGLRLIHKRSRAMEIAGHEFWDPSGKKIWFDLQMPRGEKFFLAGADLASGEEIHYPLERDQWSVHFNISRDGKLFAGDGGASNMVAHATNGKWLYLFRPQPNGTLQPERLCNMAEHDYHLEPNVNFTPDGKWVIFRSNMQGSSQVYAVEVAR